MKTASKKVIRNRSQGASNASSSSPSGGVSLKRRVDSANRWRENYNPLRSLVISRVIVLLEAGERGEMADLQWLYRFVEKRFPTLRALIKRWRGAIGKLDWQIRVKSQLPEGATDAMAEAQQKTLRARYELIDNLRAAINFIAHAEFRGYAILNKHRAIGGKDDGAVVHFELIDQWNWVRDGQQCEYFWNPDAQNVGPAFFKNRSDAVKVTEGHPDFIVAEEEMPIDEIAVVNFLRQNLCDKDWDAFVELFGIERPNVIGPPNVPKDKEDEYLDAAERIANGEGGYLPHGSDVKYPGQRGSGGAPFLERLNRLDEQLVLAGTGGLLTMLAKNTGLGKGSTDAHADGFDDLAQTKAREVSEIFQKQFDLATLEETHSGEPVCVYFQLGGEDEEDAGELMKMAVDAKSAGFQMDAEELGEKVGYKLEKVEEAVPAPTPGNKPAPLPGKKKITNRAEDVPPAQTNEAKRYVLADLQPLFTKLERIQQITDDALRTQKLRELVDSIDTLKNDINADPALAQYLAQLMAGAMAKELTKGAA